MTNVTLITYRRGTETVRSVGTYDHDRNPNTAKIDAWALRGRMEVKGHVFDTLERMDGMTHLLGGRTYSCTMEQAKNFQVKYVLDGKVEKEDRRQIRPNDHDRQVWKNGELVKSAILIHPGSYPHDFVGCIGVGFRTNYGLRESYFCFEAILELCGGFEKDRVVHLAVEGDMPRR